MSITERVFQLEHADLTIARYCIHPIPKFMIPLSEEASADAACGAVESAIGKFSPGAETGVYTYFNNFSKWVDCDYGVAREQMYEFIKGFYRRREGSMLFDHCVISDRLQLSIHDSIRSFGKFLWMARLQRCDVTRLGDGQFVSEINRNTGLSSWSSTQKRNFREDTVQCLIGRLRE